MKFILQKKYGIKAYKYRKEYHKKLFLKNLLDNTKVFLSEIKFIDFFNKNAGLWGFIALILIILGWLFFSDL